MTAGDARRPVKIAPGSGDEADDHNARLIAHLYDLIDEAGGALDFSEFMQCALYEPGLGYYAAGQRKFGPGGDFVTAPHMGTLFGECLARQCSEVLAGLDGGDVLEFGAGDGSLAVQILESLRSDGRLPAQYAILELSAELRERQQRTIAAQCPDLLPRCRWLDRLPDAFEGVVIANEVLDAMPVERFRVSEDGLRIIQVAWTGDSFGETTRPAEAGELRDIAGLDLPAGYESEAGVLAQQWVEGIADWLRRGVVLIIDYGFPAHEFYHPERSRGTLMCHHRHRAHTDPYRHVGMQDITAHLDFSALARHAHDAGLEVMGFTHQAAFLLSLGLLDLVQSRMDAANDEDRWRLSQEVQQLTQTYEMGELFKVLALGRGCPGELTGFTYIDHTARL
ncbi:MAG: SAM-dependent methyltransferase [Gammaproteobacteria bacterium]|nr:SAM-dependent methyltransferase [Gammaproteobacteria bacterium]